MAPSVNAAPAFGATLNASPTYIENGAPLVLDASVHVVDTELAATGNYAGASLTLARGGGEGAQDLYSASGNLGAFGPGGSTSCCRASPSAR